MKNTNGKRKYGFRRSIGVKLLAVTAIVAAQYQQALAQGGSAGIQAADAQVRSYFADGTNLMYAIGALLGLIGAVKVYQKWNSGDPRSEERRVGKECGITVRSLWTHTHKTKKKT